ncbi:hypothetical protein HaLaN_11578, partial [Haematococcus lacustris]
QQAAFPPATAGVRPGRRHPTLWAAKGVWLPVHDCEEPFARGGSRRQLLPGPACSAGGIWRVCPLHEVYFSLRLRIEHRSTPVCRGLAWLHGMPVLSVHDYISPCTPPPPSTFLMMPSNVKCTNHMAAPWQGKASTLHSKA